MLVLALVLTANPYLDEGAALFERMLYEKAVQRLRRATEVSASTVAERRRAHDLLARSLAALGQPDEARRTFVALLSLDSGAPLPADASPTIRRLFVEAKEQLYPRGKASLRRVPAPEPRLTLELSDPWELVARVELRAEPPATVTLEPATLMSADLPEGTRSATVVALSASDETVGQLGPLAFGVAELAPRVVAPLAPVAPVTPSPVAALATPATVAADEPAPRRPRWPAIAVAAGSLALLAAGAGLSAAAAADSNAAPAQHFASDTRALDDSARDKGVAGVVCFGAGAAGAVGAAVLFFTW